MRSIIGASSAVQGQLVFTDLRLSVLSAAVGVIAIAAGGALLLGLLTPIASALVCLGSVAIIFTGLRPASPSIFESGMAALEFVTMSASLVVLGPGAISLDARMFGRRKIIIGQIPRSKGP